MEENITPEVQMNTKTNSTGCLGEVGWFFGGAVLPMASLTFYRKAAQKSVGSAVLFFVVFTIFISALVTVNFGMDMYSVTAGIQEAYAKGEVPEITISHGVAEVDGEQPFILFNGRDTNGQSILVAVDTTGRITEIDTDRFDQGLLLTRTELHVLNAQNGYQVAPLSELHDMFDKDPIIIDAESVSRLWTLISITVMSVGFIFLVLWYTVVRLMIISVIALVLWGIVSLMRPKTEFGPIIITGLYALVPAVYLAHLFSRSGMRLPGFQTIFLLGFWIIGLVGVFADALMTPDERPMRLWTALIGLPMLTLYVVDLFVEFPALGGIAALWLVTLLTVLTLACLRLFFRFTDKRPPQPPLEPASQP
jgi:hypothetical protein